MQQQDKERDELSGRIRHDMTECRFWLLLDGCRGELDYRMDGLRMVIIHTGVPQPIAGRGVAAALVEAALAFAGHSGLKVVLACSYAEAYLQRHPEYRSLLA